MNESEAPPETDARSSLFAVALAAEQLLAWIYRTAAGLVAPSEASRLLEELARIEDQHAQQLAQAHPDLAASDIAESSEWTISRFRKQIIPRMDLNNAKELLVVATRAEIGGGLFYDQWAVQTPDPAARELALRLRDQEEAHREALAGIYRKAFGTAIEENPTCDEPLLWPNDE